MGDGGKRLLREGEGERLFGRLEHLFFFYHNRCVVSGGITSAFNPTPRLENVG